MQHVSEPSAKVDPVLNALEGKTCTFCENGKLVRRIYKGNDAVVCGNCETPGAQFW